VTETPDFITESKAAMKRRVDALRDGVWDLLILGGGITGAGVALDAALRGFRVALIDKGDFASGTSSASSKLVHGGLRYLEHGEFRLVYEALHERGRLLRNAPHLVHPLRFVLPFYRESRMPAWKGRAGLFLYDLLAGGENIARSRRIDVARLCCEFPTLRSSDLLSAATYYDAQMDDARVCIDVLKSAANEGACLANYVEAVAFEAGGVRVVDRVGGGEFIIRTRQILNATGPWVDHVCRLAGDTSGPYLKPTKGVHLVAPDHGLSAAFLLLHPADGRVFFVIPWLSKTVIGTTDTLDTAGPDAVAVTPDDVAYLLEGHNYYFSPPLNEAQILGSFAGLRPLIQSKAGQTASMTRDFRVFTSPSGMLSVAGGKYTTYRHMAEVITDEIARRLGNQRLCRTRDYRLDGAPVRPWLEFQNSVTASLHKIHEFDERIARHLVNRYGRRAFDVAEYAVRDPELAKPIIPGEPDIRAELAFQRDHEMAIFAEDSLYRRTRLGLFGHDSVMPPPALGRGKPLEKWEVD
jgi:glycerol-3-phosphate dehydrogenase